MQKHTEWKVEDHGPIQKLEPNLWRVEGAVPGMKLRRVMTLAQMQNGDVIIHNAIALEEYLMREIDDWGQVRYIVVPNAYHRLDCERFKRRYPNAKIVCPRTAVKRVSELVAVDLTFDKFKSDESVTLRHLEGTKDGEGVMLVRHGQSSSVVLNDLVFNMPHQSGFMGWVLRYLTKSTGGPKVSRVASTLVIKNKAAIVRELNTLADTPGLVRVIVSHHEVIDEKPAEVLRRLASEL